MENAGADHRIEALDPEASRFIGEHEGGCELRETLSHPHDGVIARIEGHHRVTELHESIAELTAAGADIENSRRVILGGDRELLHDLHLVAEALSHTLEVAGLEVVCFTHSHILQP